MSEEKKTLSTLKVSRIYRSVCSFGENYGKSCSVVRLFGGDFEDKNDRHVYARQFGAIKKGKDAQMTVMTTKEVFEATTREVPPKLVIITGGEPMEQEQAVIELVNKYESSFGENVQIVIETRGKNSPDKKMPKSVSFCLHLVLSNALNSQNTANASFTNRIKLEVIKKISEGWNTEFLFDIRDANDWKEVAEIFAMMKRVKKTGIDAKIWLSPVGNNAQDVLRSASFAYNLAKGNNVGFCICPQTLLLGNKKEE